MWIWAPVNKTKLIKWAQEQDIFLLPLTCQNEHRPPDDELHTGLRSEPQTQLPRLPAKAGQSSARGSTTALRAPCPQLLLPESGGGCDFVCVPVSTGSVNPAAPPACSQTSNRDLGTGITRGHLPALPWIGHQASPKHPRVRADTPGPLGTPTSGKRGALSK